MEEAKEETKTANPAKAESKAAKSDGSFPSYESWLADLGDWKEPLKEFLATSKLADIHRAVAKEYASGAVRNPWPAP